MESLNAVDILSLSDAASDLNHQTQIRSNQAPIIALSQSQHLTPQSSPSLGARDPALDTTGTGKAVLTPEEVLLTWCHCAEKAVRCHSCLWLTQAPLLFLCGFRDPWHVLNREHAACHVGKKMEKPSTRHAFTYQLFRWPQVTTRSGFIEEKNCRGKYRICGWIRCCRTCLLGKCGWNVLTRLVPSLWLVLACDD